MTAEPLRLIVPENTTPLRSQTLYHGVAHAMDESTPDTLILVSPATPYVCIGFHQDLEKEVDVAFCQAHGLPVVRREVGGGAVYLDENQLFAQWVFRGRRLPAHLEDRFDLYVQPLVNTYRDLGIEAYFRPVNDIHVAGKKIGGTGAALIGAADVVVGSFMFDFDKQTMARVLKVSSEKMRDKIAEGLAAYMTTMRDLLPELPSRSDVIARYVAHCETALQREIVPGELTAAELAKAAELDAVFTSPEWLEQAGGHRRAHVKIHEDVHVGETAHKAPGGLIRVTARVREGALDDVELSGDFAMVPAHGLAAVEAALIGCPLGRDALERVVAGAYAAEDVQSPGLTPSDFATAILQLAP